MITSNLETMSRVMDAARKQAGLDEGTVSPLRDYTPAEIADTIIYLENIAFGSARADERVPNLHVPHAQRVEIIREARRMVVSGGYQAFSNFTAMEAAGALVDLANVLIATKEELVSVRPKTIALLASAVRELWPDLADEIVKRWTGYKAADTQLLSELLERLRK